MMSNKVGGSRDREMRGKDKQTQTETDEMLMSSEFQVAATKNLVPNPT